MSTLIVSLSAREQGGWFIVACLLILGLVYGIPPVRRYVMRPFEEQPQRQPQIRIVADTHGFAAAMDRIRRATERLVRQIENTPIYYALVDETPGIEQTIRTARKERDS